jgi:hypothetical protein
LVYLLPKILILFCLSNLLIMSPTWLRFVPVSCVLSSISTFLVFTQQDERGNVNHAAEMLCIIPIPYSFEKC